MIMLPEFYETHLKRELGRAEYLLLKILINLLQSIKIASKWATILARREMGELLQVVAEDLEMPYETVKTYLVKVGFVE